MLYYPDTCIVIYAVEGSPPFQQRARQHIANLQAAGHHFAVSDFTRLECLVIPLETANGALLWDYERFFLAPDVIFIPLIAPIFERAASIRGMHRNAVTNRRYSVADSLHVTAAVQATCDSFLTNDLRL